jgi:hypothetical protein
VIFGILKEEIEAKRTDRIYLPLEPPGNGREPS